MAESGSGEDRDSMISTFCSITGADTERGQFYLESANWNLPLATQSFFEHTDEGFGHTSHVLSEAHYVEPGTGPVMPQQDPRVDIADDSPSQSSTDKSDDTTLKGIQQSVSSSRFATLDSIRASNDSGESSDDDGQAFYAGGSTRSGQQVLGPSRKKKDAHQAISDMFKLAKEHGAEVVDPSDNTKRMNQLLAFKGTGHRLGSDLNEPTERVHDLTPSQRPQMDMVLKLWQNGFSVDDGPLRSYENTENNEFLESIRRGEIPRELHHMAAGSEVNLNMEDHRHDDYVEPKRVNRAFVGEGHRLGSPAADVISAVITNLPDNPEKCADDAQKALNVDDSKPITNIQIRLADGSRLTLKLNLSQTIAEIRQFICNARPVYGATPFVLMTTFPNKELSEETMTVKDANLLNACIVQRIK